MKASFIELYQRNILNINLKGFIVENNFNQNLRYITRYEVILNVFKELENRTSIMTLTNQGFD